MTIELNEDIADPRARGNMADMPFDAKRMIFGGFEVIVDA